MALTWVGFTPGQGTGEIFKPPDATGFNTAIHAIGPGAPSGQGTPWASGAMKCFDTGAGYPNFPTTWTSFGPTFSALNGGKPMFFLYAFGSGAGSPSLTPPTPSAIQSFLGSLPAGQKVGFCYVSEAEGGGDLGGSAYVNNQHTISQNLNTALAFMQAHPVSGNSPSFYTRQNFPNVSAALMSHYQTSSPTDYIPAFGDVDWYGADMYHKGTNTNNHVLADPRFINYVQAVKTKINNPTNFAQTQWAFPEYGIDLAGIGSEQARANLMQADFNDMTGPNKPGQGITAWIYWYKLGNSGQEYPFPNPANETEAQAAPTIAVWQGIISSISGSNSVNVFGVPAAVSVAAPPPGSTGGSFFVRSMNNATTGASATTTLNVLKDTHTQPGDLIQIWVATNSGTGITFSCPGFTPVPAVS